MSARPRAGAAAAALAAIAALWVACIIPDRGIQFEGGPANPGAVRILDRAPTPQRWSQWCLDRELKQDVDGTDTFCPNVAPTQPGGLMQPAMGSYCICPDGQRDARAPALWTIYAEDPDLEGDDPKDSLYGVLLLDPDPTDDAPYANLAYQNYLEPCAVGTPVEPSVATLVPDGSRYAQRVQPPIARDTAAQWAFAVDDAFSDTIDLCNDDNGTALPAGLHNLQFLVTD